MDYSLQGGDTSQCLTGSVPRVQLPQLRKVISPLLYPFLFCLPSHTFALASCLSLSLVVIFLLHTTFMCVNAQAKPRTVKKQKSILRYFVLAAEKGAHSNSLVSLCLMSLARWLTRDVKARTWALCLLFAWQMPLHKCVYDAIRTAMLLLFGQCLLLTLHLWLVCLCDWSEDCWQRSFSADWWQWEICGCNPPKLYWYVPLYCPDQRCQLRFFFLPLASIMLCLSPSLSRIRKVEDIHGTLSFNGDGLLLAYQTWPGRVFPFFLKPGLYDTELSPAGLGILRYTEAVCCNSGRQSVCSEGTGAALPI